MGVDDMRVVVRVSAEAPVGVLARLEPRTELLELEGGDVGVFAETS